MFQGQVCLWSLSLLLCLVLLTHDQTHILLIHEHVFTPAQKDKTYTTSTSSLNETFHGTFDCHLLLPALLQ